MAEQLPELPVPGGMPDEAYLQLQVGIRILINAPGQPVVLQSHALQEVIIQIVAKAQVIQGELAPNGIAYVLLDFFGSAFPCRRKGLFTLQPQASNELDQLCLEVSDSYTRRAGGVVAPSPCGGRG